MTNNKIFSNEEKRDFAIKMKEITKFCLKNNINVGTNHNSYTFSLNGKNYIVSNFGTDDFKKYITKLANQGVKQAIRYLQILEKEIISIQASKLRIMEIYNDLKAGKQLDKNGREIMKTSEIEFKMDDIYYITQYSEFYYDQSVLEAFNHNLKGLKTLKEKQEYKSKVIEIIENMGNVDDKINQKIYYRLVSSNETNPKQLEQYNFLLKTLSSNSWANNSQSLKYGLNEFMSENNYLDKDTLWEIVDNDLKENGMDSQYIYSFNNFNEITDPLYANDPYVYVDPYLRVHNVTEDKIKNEYIDFVCDNKKFETLEEKQKYKTEITKEIKNMGDDWINKCDLDKYGYEADAFMWENSYALREQLIEDIDTDLKQKGENSKWICASNKSNALYDDRQYVYIDAYLNFHNVSENELKEAYIDSISEMNLEDVLNLDVLKMENKSSDSKNILSEFDKTPTSFEDSEVIKEYEKSFNEKSNNNENIKSNSIKR